MNMNMNKKKKNAKQKQEQKKLESAKLMTVVINIITTEN